MISLKGNSAKSLFRSVKWGFVDADVTMVDRNGDIVVQPMSMDSEYTLRSRLIGNGFDRHVFREYTDDHMRMSYLHSTGFAAVIVPEGFVVCFPDSSPSVDDEDRLRELYHEWSTRKSRMPPAKIRDSPFALIQDARVAVAAVLGEGGDADHMTLASEYIAWRDYHEMRKVYDVDTMHLTLVTLRSLASGDETSYQDASDEVQHEAENGPEYDYDYLSYLGERLARLA